MILPRTSEGLYLLQRVRDEAHRFAITFHRQRRSKAMTASAPRRRPGARRDPAQGAAAPLRLAEAARGPPSEDEIAEVPGIGRRWPRPLRRRWRPQAGQAVPAVNVTTGEILD